MLKLLIKYGADVNPDDYTEPSCLQCGLMDFYDKQVESTRIIVFLTDMVERSKSVLHLVCLRDDLELANFLILNGCNYQLEDEFGKLPIDYITSLFIRKQFSEIIKLKDE